MDESISHARKRPAPVVLCPELDTEWLFDVGADLAVWPWLERPAVTRLQRTRTPKVKAKSGHVPVYAYSVTTGTHLHLESGLEHDLVRELDRRADVTWLVAQPCKLRLPANGRYQYRYLVNSSEWVNDEAADRYVANEHGTTNSVVETYSVN